MIRPDGGHPHAPGQSVEPTWELEGNERFELRRALGAGAFGAVFEVLDRERGAKVALKLLKRVGAADLYHFKQEFHELADLVHPNLVRLYELLAQGDRWFFTMELVEGASAVAFVRHDYDAREAPTMDARSLSEPSPEPAGLAEAAGGRFDEARLRQVLVQLVEGLSALHRAGKMHRDVKPSNVLVTPEGRVALVDFGLVVRLSTSAELSRSTLVGTPAYLAPEIVLGQPASEASDWYAVGVLLYEAITGRVPFTGSIHQVLSAKIESDPPAPSTLVPDLAPDLDRLCVELLSRRAEARPAGAEILGRVGGKLRVAPPKAPFVGRALERAAVAELFREGRRAGGASVALVGGSSGIGKSTLVAQVCLDLQEAAPDAVILAGRCWEQESVPYKAIDGIVDSLSRHLRTLSQRAVAPLLPHDVHTLVRLFPVLEQVRAIADAPRSVAPLRGARDLRRSAFRALRQLLARLGAERPLVLVVADLHWGDADSGALLVDLLAPPDPPPLLLLASYRSDEVETSACLRVALPALAAMRGQGLRVTSIALAALPEPDAQILARALLPEGMAGDDDLAAAVAREAGGRPFFIRELAELSSARASRRTPPPQGEQAISLDALVQARTAELSAGARRLLEILAVAGRPIDRAAAARAAQLGDDEPAAYSALRGARLVRGRDAEGRDEIEVYHDRIRETVAGRLSPARRREAFLTLASALDGRGLADVETLAVYFEEGGQRARAAELTVIAAGDAARSLAFDRAARLYRLAIGLRDAGDAQVGPLHEALGEALVTAGRGAEAAEALALAAATASPDRAFELRRRAAEQLLFAGRVDQGMAALRSNLAEAGIRLPRADALVALGFLLHLAWLVVRGFRLRGRARTSAPVLRRIDACLAAARALGTVETVRGAYFVARALTLALGAGDPARAFDALLLFCLYGAALGNARRAYERRALAALAGFARTLADPLHDGGSTPRPRAHDVAPPSGADRHSIPRVHASMALLRGALAMVVHDLPRAREPLAEATRILADVGGDVAWELNSVREFTFQRLLWTGAWKELCARLPAALQDARDHGNEHLVRSLTLRFGHVAPLLADDPDAALSGLRAGTQGWWPPRFSTLDCYVLWTRCDILVYAAWARGGEARAHVEGMWPAFSRSPLLRVQLIAGGALAARARAALTFAAAEGVSPADRELALRTAWDCAQRVRAVPDHPAKTMVDIVEASVAAARGDTETAVARFILAEAVLDAIGCAHYAAAARRRRGALLGGDEGRALVEGADALLRAEGAVSPARLAAMLAPGAVG